MFKENLYQPFEILLREHEVFPLEEHQHSFFEAVYILSGDGIFEVFRNDDEARKFEYSAGSLFLIPPNTTHCFRILKRSRFLFVRFTDQYVDEYMDDKAKHALYLSYSTPKIDLSGRERTAAGEVFALWSRKTNSCASFPKGLFGVRRTSCCRLPPAPCAAVPHLMAVFVRRATRSAKCTCSNTFR